MQTIQLRKAERSQAKLRIGLMGVSGSGKTYSALLLAKGLCGDWGKIALIDTENGRGDLYSDLGAYSIITLEAPFSPERYIEAIEACENAGMEVIVIDSTSHEWDGKDGCLELNEKLAIAKYKGNTWAAWNETTPRHRKFIDKIISSPCHVITTLRSKTDTIQTEDKKIKKVGLKEIQREGFEYEMTLSFSIEREGHFAVPGKDNTHIFDARDPFVITEADGKLIKDWNSEVGVSTKEIKRSIAMELKRLELPFPKLPDEAIKFVEISAEILSGIEFNEDNFEKILTKLKKITDKKKARVDVFGEDEPAPASGAEKSEKGVPEAEKVKEVEIPVEIKKAPEKPVKAPEEAPKVAPKKKAPWENWDKAKGKNTKEEKK